MLEQLLAGESVTVRIPGTERIFQIRPRANVYHLPVYDVFVPCGANWKLQRSHKGMIMGKERLQEWLIGLEEVTA